MRIGGQRRSTNFEDRGRGVGGGGGLPAGALLGAVMRMFGLRGVILIGIVLLGFYFLAPASMRSMVLGSGGGGSVQTSGSVCEGAHADACDFSRAILGSTEDVWRAQFQQGRLPNYGVQPGAYSEPRLVVYADNVETGCGVAPSSVGPFYCPQDRNLYIDPSFYQVMATRLSAPGDFAQAYVIAHEVAHHVQNLLGAMGRSIPGETQNQTSVRVELQADCLAGVWGHTATASLAIDEADLREALNAAHSIGDDTLQRQSQGRVNPNQFSHGTSAQRMTWFRRGFDSGDARQCDTFAVPNYNQL